MDVHISSYNKCIRAGSPVSNTTHVVIFTLQAVRLRVAVDIIEAKMYLQKKKDWYQNHSFSPAPLLQSVYKDTTAIHEMQLNQAPAPNVWSICHLIQL